MPTRSVTPALLILLGATAFLTLPSAAQIPVDYPAVGVTAPGPCNGAPDVGEAPAQTAETGIFDVWIYPLMTPHEQIRAVRLGSTRPGISMPLAFGRAGRRCRG